MPGTHFMIHPHHERKDNQPGMTSPAEIHSIPCSTPLAFGTDWLFAAQITEDPYCCLVRSLPNC